MKIGVVGPKTWFSGHFPEGWQTDPDVLVLDVDERDYRFLIPLINFRPDVTLFYRPELYPKRLVNAVSGFKLAFMSEPVPPFIDGALVSSEENALRLRVYSMMDWDVYDQIYFYDSTKAETIRHLKWPVDYFRPLPVDTSIFCCDGSENRTTDVFFIGKPTPHRIRQMEFLKLMRVSYRWIAHGLTDIELAAEFRKSRVVLNIHADGLPAMEPRIHLAACCGAIVLSEKIDGNPAPFEDRVMQYDNDLNESLIRLALARSNDPFKIEEEAVALMSTRRFIATALERAL